MPGDADTLATVEVVHAAGLDAELWPAALSAVTRTIGGVGATLEVIDKRLKVHREFHGFGLAPAHQLTYVRHYAALNPRIAVDLGKQPGTVGWDYLAVDEAAMDRSPFYAEFLAPQDLRYAISGILRSSRNEFAIVAVQRSPRQGHVGEAEIALMARLLPHIQQAFDVARRLKAADATRLTFERALDWLADGVVLVRADGGVVYVNAAFQAMDRRDDGIGIRKGMLTFAPAGTRERFDDALAAVLHLHAGKLPEHAGADFPVARRTGGPAYLVSVRPLLDRECARRQGEAIAIVFVHDPLSREGAALRLLRELFGLTEAEASVARAIQAGSALTDYARERAVSVNTVYTHLRRIKEKTGCTRVPELIRKLNDLQAPLRVE